MKGIIYQESEEFTDARGSFVKVYQNGSFHAEVKFNLQEMFFSKSHKGVIRGFHLQTGESASTRLISVLSGSILDVLLDLRPESSTYLEFHTLELSEIRPHVLIVPPGVAHAFLALEDCLIVYASDKSYNPLLDKGVNPNSSGYKWPIRNPIISERDSKLPSIEEWIKSN